MDLLMELLVSGLFAAAKAAGKVIGTVLAVAVTVVMATLGVVVYWALVQVWRFAVGLYEKAGKRYMYAVMDAMGVPDAE